MIFYQKDNTGGVWDGRKFVPFVAGKLETDDPALIRQLKESGYRSDDDGRETEPGDKGGQAVKKEPTVKELREQAKEKGIDGFSRMNKPELTEALKEGE